MPNGILRNIRPNGILVKKNFYFCDKIVFKWNIAADKLSMEEFTAERFWQVIDSYIDKLGLTQESVMME